MSFAIVNYTGNGSTTTYAITFPYITSSHVIVKVDNVLKTAGTDYTFPTSSTIQFTTAPANGLVISISRSSSRSTRLVDYQDGSTVTESILDQDSNQLFFVAQEAFDTSENSLPLDTDNKYNAGSRVIKNVANPSANQDAVTKHYLENTWLSTADKANLTSVAGQITPTNNISTLAGISANITTLAGTAGLTTLASNAGSIATVAGQITPTNNISTVAGAVGNIGTVATNIANVNSVGGSIANVNTLAPISGNITTVAGISGNVTTVAGMSANVSTVAGISGAISTVASNAGNISAVATDIAKVITTANDLNEAISEIDTVANAITNVDLVGNNIANVNLVGGSIANVNTVGSNIGTVNNFADRYRVSASAPVTSLDLGDLYFDTSANTMKVYSSGGWINAGSSVNGTADRFRYNATASQTTFSGADVNGNTLAYDAGFLDVYLNGIKLVNTVDFTASNGTSIVLTTGATLDDILEVIAYGTFQLANFSITDANDVPPLGTAGQALVVNSGATALEFSTIQASEITTVGNYFSNWNEISSNLTTTTTSTKNLFLCGDITVSGSAIWTVAGSGSLKII